MQNRSEMDPELVRAFEQERKAVNELAQWINDSKEMAEYNREIGHPAEKLESEIQTAELDHQARNAALEARGF